MRKNTKHLTRSLTGTFVALVLAGGTNAALAKGDSYTLEKTCAFLPADRATEFHGNPDRSKLNLGMAGNQWVVFDEAMRQFNLYIGKGDGSEPAHRDNNTGFTLADLNDNANRYFVELIPPGQIRNQIMTGCMTLGNDEDRNFLPLNFQVDFDVFASTNYNEMKRLADAGFIDEAVPYISNRLDLMVAVGNPLGIGNTMHTGNADFDAQFDIIMDLLSGDVVASSLDHINEGIHNAANNYMKNAHNWVKANDQMVTMTYTYANNITETATKWGSQWIQDALAVVATPMPGSPGEQRLISGDAGENHASHDLAANGCGTTGDLLFCEYAVLNKSNTHESRVHHVETPNGIQGVAGYVPVDVGYVWITELAYQLNNGNLNVQGMVGLQDTNNLGIPRPAGSTNVNNDITYSLALLATSENQKRGRQFIDFLRSPQGQAVYTAGGFAGLTPAQLDGGYCYGKPVNGSSARTDRTGDGSCDDWLNNN